MNSLLAQIYGTGINKTASEETEEIDLNQISAAQLLAGLEDGSIVLPENLEKEAGEDEEIDLSKLSGAELLALLNEVEGEDTLDKMASDGSAEYWDMAGRIMAHAYADEMSKVAGEELPDVIDINEIDGETMLALLESGEYEIADGFDKEAGARAQAAKAWLQRQGKRVSEGAKKGWESTKGGAKKAGGEIKKPWSDARRYHKLMRAGGATRTRAAAESGRAFLGSTSGKVQAGIAGTGAVGATGYGAYKLSRKGKK